MKAYLLISLLFSCSFLFAQNENSEKSSLILIYDASGSMWGQIDGATKNEIATAVVTATVSNLPQDQKIGLVAYGHRSKGDCKDVEFLVPSDNSDKSKVSTSLSTIKPLGKTPLAYSASLVIDKLKIGKTKATIILLTDGIESCDGDLCKVIQEAKAAGIEFKLHIIGFGLQDGDTKNLVCAANAGDGEYFDAADAGSLGEVLQRAATTTVDDPDGNFTVYTIKNGRAIDAYIRAFPKSGDQKEVTARTYADTAHFYLPPGDWDLEVKPLEQSDVNPIVLKVNSGDPANSHRTVSFDAGQIIIKTENNGEGWDAVVNIYEAGSKARAASGRTYGKEDLYDLNPGIYDVELTALKIEGSDVKYLKANVEVKANEAIEVMHNFKSGIAIIGASSSTGLVDCVVNFRDAKSKDRVADGRTYTRETSNPKAFILTPGTYEVTLTTLGEHKGKKETFTIEVTEGKTVEKITTF